MALVGLSLTNYLLTFHLLIIVLFMPEPGSQVCLSPHGPLVGSQFINILTYQSYTGEAVISAKK